MRDTPCPICHRPNCRSAAHAEERGIRESRWRSGAAPQRPESVAPKSNPWQDAARGRKAGALIKVIEGERERNGFPLAHLLTHLKRASDEWKAELANQAGVHPPSPHTWKRVIAYYEDLLREHERRVIGGAA